MSEKCHQPKSVDLSITRRRILPRQASRVYEQKGGAVLVIV
jgi:hypothetical protein